MVNLCNCHFPDQAYLQICELPLESLSNGWIFQEIVYWNSSFYFSHVVLFGNVKFRADILFLQIALRVVDSSYRKVNSLTRILKIASIPKNFLKPQKSKKRVSIVVPFVMVFKIELTRITSYMMGNHIPITATAYNMKENKREENDAINWSILNSTV